MVVCRMLPECEGIASDRLPAVEEHPEKGARMIMRTGFAMSPEKPCRNKGDQHASSSS